jgi:hypothetical protein
MLCVLAACSYINHAESAISSHRQRHFLVAITIAWHVLSLKQGGNFHILKVNQTYGSHSLSEVVWEILRVVTW